MDYESSCARDDQKNAGKDICRSQINIPALLLQLIANAFEDVTDDEMKLIDAMYDDHAKALMEAAWGVTETK